MTRCGVVLSLALMWSASPGGLAASPPVTGRVEDGSGTGLHEAIVELLEPGSMRRISRTVSDHNGEFAFTSVPAGSIELVVSKHGFEPRATLIAEADRGRPIIVVLDGLPQAATRVSVFGAIPRSAASSSFLREEEFTRRVIQDTGDVLRVVPGLTVVQHAGGGKANQYLLRGFDADHGTDLYLSYGGIPVNMVSHAHGQGYADLNFLIPETLESIEVFKGPYFAELGNLGTAGSAILRLRDEFEAPFLSVQAGRFNTSRLLAGWSPKSTKTRGFVALEGKYSDGPFVDPQDFGKLNLATRWTFQLPSNQTLSLLGTGYGGRWNQSGQIPLREVEAGRLDRFGAIDPSEGGKSQRFNFSLSHQKLWSNQAVNSQFYAVHYELDLFSNFTFFLNDPVRGDGIKQSDHREIIGGHVQHHYHHTLGSLSSLLTSGFDYRQDFADVGLFRQEKRQVFDTVVDSQINERNLSFYTQEEVRFHPRVKAVVGIRHDRFRFDVTDRAGDSLKGVHYRAITTPKASLEYTLRDRESWLYLNYGRGFHSNDARSVVRDPTRISLAAADGYEIGYRGLYGTKLEVSAAYWILDLEGELVFVGDEGTTELRGPTRRYGPEVELKWRISDYLWLDTDLSYTTGHYKGTSEVIARAPRFVAGGGMSFASRNGLSGSVRLRHVGDHPLVEDNSVQAQGYTIADLYLEKSFSEHWTGFVSIENLFNSDYREAQTFFESRLASEPVPVADTHFNPGDPFTLQLGIRYRF